MPLKKSWDTKLSYECYSSFKKQRKLIETEKSS